MQYLMNDTLETPDDVAKYLGIQPLTTIPEVSLGGFSDDRDDDKKKPFHWAGK